VKGGEVVLLRIDFPSERRKLFFLIFFSFLLIGFSIKYVWVQWHDPQRVTTKATIATTEGTTDPSDGRYTVQQIQQGEQMATTFMQLYLNDTIPKRQRLASLKESVTKEFYAILQAESEQARPIQETTLFQGQRITKVSCEQTGIKLKCLVVTEWKDIAKNRTLEQIYECQLVPLNRAWKVEEVNRRGSLD
jgi:hypothetical protein